MRSVHPESAAIASRSPSENVPSAEGQRCNTVAVLPRFPHRAANVAATWRAAKSWIGLAWPRIALDSVPALLLARFPELAENVTRLEQAARDEASTFENTVDADMSAFLAALGRWEKAMLDALSALACTKGGTHV